MPCHAAIADNFLAIPEDETIEKALKALKKNKVETAAITNAEGQLAGLFSYQILLSNLLPVNIAVAGDTVAMDAAPGVAKRLRKVMPLPVKDIMSQKFEIVFPETPTWQGLGHVLDSKHPVVVIDRESKKPLGIINEKSLYNEFERMQN